VEPLSYRSSWTHSLDPLFDPLKAVVAMPSATLEEITDYIMDKEAIFESWRRFKAGLASGKANLNRSYRR
jgi:hypothetical protein